ncbi:MAG: response regulator [Candidatus Riflebacteria bacterium]|nr:response regulator [Candidatus Riflebacteria bacterium]
MPQKILLIEDNQTDIGLTKRAFEKSHIYNELIVKEDGQDALDYLFGTKDIIGAVEDVLPELILLDLKMPRINGLDVLRQIRKDVRTRRIPVVILTSSGEEQDIAAAYDLCANSYIRKPVDFKQLAGAIQIICTYWLVLNNPFPQRKQP